MKATAPDPPIDQQVEELIAAGWKKIYWDLWESPRGVRWLGPHGAWVRMREAKAASNARTKMATQHAKD
jgi:hypothetical protein